MHAEDRLIHFSTELIHPPVQHQTPALQRLYYELSQQPGLAYDNTDFTMPAQPKFHSKRGTRTQSLLIFLPDRLVLIEEWADVALSQFVERVKGVGETALEVLKLAPFMAQTVTLRSTCSLTHYDNATKFLMSRVCRVDDSVASYFQRPLATGGLRLILPETPDYPGNMHVLIESFRHDPRDVFVEVKGLFGRPGAQLGGLGVAATNVHAVRRIIVDNVYPFLNQFDRADQESS